VLAREGRGQDADSPPALRRGDLAYGTDKPDLRFGLELVEVTEVFRGSEFKAFAGAIEDGAVVRALNAGKRSSRVATWTGSSRRPGAGREGAGLGRGRGGGWRSPVAKFLSGRRSRPRTRPGRGEGDVLLVVARCPRHVRRRARRAAQPPRRAARPDRGGSNALVWIVDWPLLGWNEEEGAGTPTTTLHLARWRI
jgi:aspartyl-tRNA synthetase